MKRIALLSALSLLATSCAEREPLGPRGTDAAFDHAVEAPGALHVKVMSRNLYLGADISPMLSATSPMQVAVLAGRMYGQVVANDFPTRARALAAEIASVRPHLVGLQEVATYRLQVPGDYLIGNPTPAIDVTYDFLALLEVELSALGLDYRPVASTPGMDVELPMAVSATELADIRMSIHDVILARHDVRIERSGGGVFQAKLVLPIAGGLATLVIPRGWTSVDVVVGGQRLAFVETHLEAFHPAVQEAQARQLASILETFDAPTILVGDLNSRPDGSRGESYGIIRAAGFVDAWAQANPEQTGYTCCHEPGLRTTADPLDERIDFVFVRDAITRLENRIAGSVEAWLLGESVSDLETFGIWPSDHAGVAAELRTPRPAAGAP